MKLYYHKDPLGNFGDDLNPWLLEKLLPEFFSGHCYHAPELRSSDRSFEPLFVGIGTILNHNIPKEPRKAVFGSGAGYGDVPKIDSNWNVYCVRGPRTAEALGLPRDRAVTDAAALCRKVEMKQPGKKYDYAFMPHCSTARHSYWDLVCADLGIHYIDPQQSVDDVFQSLLATEVLITEAMHGAILADTFRIPWIAVTTTSGILDVKWRDWCDSLDMEYEPWRLPSLWSACGKKDWSTRAVKFAKFQLAKHALKRVVGKSPTQLSRDPVLDACIETLESRLDRFKDDFRKGEYA